MVTTCYYYRAYRTFIAVNRWQFEPDRRLHMDCKTPQLPDDKLKKYLQDRYRGDSDDDNHASAPAAVAVTLPTRRISTQCKVLNSSQAKKPRAASTAGKKKSSLGAVEIVFPKPMLPASGPSSGSAVLHVAPAAPASHAAPAVTADSSIGCSSSSALDLLCITDSAVAKRINDLVAEGVKKALAEERSQAAAMNKNMYSAGAISIGSNMHAGASSSMGINELSVGAASSMGSNMHAGAAFSMGTNMLSAGAASMSPFFAWQGLSFYSFDLILPHLHLT
jgi:hypothetical protein